MSRELFASTTGDARYNLFFGPEEMDLFDNYSTELFEIVTQTSVKYWRIEKDASNPNNLYGESDSKIARQPVIVYCFIQQDEPVTETGRYGTDIKRRLEIFMHKEKLVLCLVLVTSLNIAISFMKYMKLTLLTYTLIHKLRWEFW